jgi:hypothetical protein
MVQEPRNHHMENKKRLMLLVAGVTVFACVTAVACIQTVAGILFFLLLLASFKFLLVSCCWSIADVPGVTNAVVGISAVRLNMLLVLLLQAFLLLTAFLMLLAPLLIMVSLFKLVALLTGL